MGKNFKDSKKLSPTTYNLPANSGITLIEVLVTMTIFVILAGGIYFSYANLLEIISRSRMRTLATSLLNREIEVVRNLAYDDIGIAGGSPAGVIPAERVINFEGQSFILNAYVRNIDDPFDGKQGQTPNDTAPADYRLVELIVTCQACANHLNPISFTTWVAPENLESSTKNGSLFVNVLDANGLPVSGASVKVENSTTTPSILINDTTNSSGSLQLVDIPTSTNAYEITITKSGYSSAKTYPLGAQANPNPLQPHATVSSQQITEISFLIDRLSTLNIKSQDYYCKAVDSVDFDYSGTKLIGQDPDVYKRTGSFTTDSAGTKTYTDIEWDSYDFTLTDTAYDFVGGVPSVPFLIDPNRTYDLGLVVVPATTTSLVVTVTASSGAPIAGAAVNLVKTGTDLTLETGRQTFTETDWSGNNYTAQDGQIDETNPNGEIHLLSAGGIYPTSTNSYLESKTIDFGHSSTTFYKINWSPLSQPIQAGTDSLKIQLASNNDNSTWTYLGPDGTANTYYTTSSTALSNHNNRRYLRYKVYLNTESESYTPTLRDLQIEFTSGCVPGAAAYFAGLPTGTYTATITKSGYTTATSSIPVLSGWQEKKIILE